MNNDTMMILVALGLGGVVLWLLMREEAGVVRSLTTQGAPCNLEYNGVKSSCAGVDYALEKTKDVGQGLWNYTLGQVLPESLRFGSTKVCRSTITGKDVWPNDIAECAKRFGVTDCNACGGYYNLATRKWPWQEGLTNGTGTTVPTPAISPVQTRLKPPGFR